MKTYKFHQLSSIAKLAAIGDYAENIINSGNPCPSNIMISYILNFIEEDLRYSEHGVLIDEKNN